MEDNGTNSARSGRKRTQVGSTNRSSVSSPTVVERTNASTGSQRLSSGARARPMSAADEFSRRDLVSMLSKGDGVLKETRERHTISTYCYTPESSSIQELFCVPRTGCVKRETTAVE
ncbi:unnamed protein product [Ectocarpus sp. 12 AP-2014]